MKNFNNQNVFNKSNPQINNEIVNTQPIEIGKVNCLCGLNVRSSKKIEINNKNVIRVLEYGEHVEFYKSEDKWVEIIKPIHGFVVKEFII